MRNETCETCVFSEPVYNPKFPALNLECRRRPPSQGQYPAAEWPKVPGDGWCGEFQAPEKAVPAKVAAAKKAAQSGDLETR